MTRAILHRITPTAYRGELHGYGVMVFFVSGHLALLDWNSEAERIHAAMYAVRFMTRRGKLIDKGHHSQHNDLENAAADAKRGYWLGRFAIAGRVIAIMCQQCGRINLFGVPKEG